MKDLSPFSGRTGEMAIKQKLQVKGNVLKPLIEELNTWDKQLEEIINIMINEDDDIFSLGSSEDIRVCHPRLMMDTLSMKT
mgnify:FL=1